MKEKWASFIIVLMLFSTLSFDVYSQVSPDSLQNSRLTWTTTVLSIGYGTTTYLLNEAWYNDYPRSSFHFYNDWGEWEHMDKIGHIFSSQFQSIYAYHLYKWAGVADKKSITYGALTALLFQSTIEVLDGFSSQWGFSVPDFGANVLGASLFVVQQATWGSQNILFKVSGGVRSYDQMVTSNSGQSILLNDRADDLFGNNAPSRLLKDYNAQTYWVSLNIKEIINAKKWPNWLNMSIGYGAENMFGGFDNSWLADDKYFNLKERDFPRYHQFYFSPDIDLTRIPTKSKFVKSLLQILNVFKVPFPTLEITSNGGFYFHFIKF
ncbi:MAG: DUF2279 domain-containing protein [Saprospiraceae bacterium]